MGSKVRKSMSLDADVIIIGAGPAGLTAAREFSKNDIDYIIIDRSKRPGEEKPCGGFIPASTLERFSIPKIKDQFIIDSVRMKFPGKELIDLSFEEALGVNIERIELANSLIDSIKDQKQRMLFGSSVTRVETDKDECRVFVTDEDESSVFASKLVIDSSGANPLTLRFMPIRERISNDRMGYGLQYHIKIERELPHSNAFLYGNKYSPGGYLWIFPRGDIVVIGTGGLISRVRANERKTYEYLDFVMENVEPFKSELAGGEIVKRDSALMPLNGITRPSFGKRVLLAGDSAGHCSPISGEGIHYSMTGGYYAAMTAIQCIKKNDYSEKILQRYEKSWISDMGSDLKWGLWLQRKLMRPSSEKDAGWSSSGFINSEKSQRIIAEMLMGRRSVLRAIAAIAPSYLRSKFG